MSTIRIKCRQCAWESDLEEDRVPRYGARFRCLQCDSLQAVIPYLSEEERLMQPLAELERSARQARSQVGSYIGSQGRPQIGPQIGPQTDPEPTALNDTISTQKGECPPSVTEAREVIDTWLAELPPSRRGPLTMALLFSEFSDELANILTLWKAAYPGEKSIRLFREQLMAALGEVPPGGERPVVSSSNQTGI